MNKSPSLALPNVPSFEDKISTTPQILALVGFVEVPGVQNSTPQLSVAISLKLSEAIVKSACP